MSTKYNVIRDINGSVTGINGFGLQFSDDIQNGLLAATVAQSITVPDNYQKWIAIFSYQSCGGKTTKRHLMCTISYFFKRMQRVFSTINVFRF